MHLKITIINHFANKVLFNFEAFIAIMKHKDLPQDRW